MIVKHTAYGPADFQVHMAPGETIMLFHADERPLVEGIIQGMLDMLDDDEHDARKVLTEVYQHVRSPERKEVN